MGVNSHISKENNSCKRPSPVTTYRETLLRNNLPLVTVRRKQRESEDPRGTVLDHEKVSGYVFLLRKSIIFRKKKSAVRDLRVLYRHIW